MNSYNNNLNNNNNQYNNNQYNNQQFYQAYNGNFNNTNYKKKPSAGKVVLIVILCFIGIGIITSLLTLNSTNKYLNDARKGSMQNEAAELVTAARTYIVANNITESGNFVFDIGSKKAYWITTNGTQTPSDNVVQKNLKQSPYGYSYQAAYVEVTHDNFNGNTVFKLHLSDGVYCFDGIDESDLSKDEYLIKDSKSVTTCSDMKQATYTKTTTN